MSILSIDMGIRNLAFAHLRCRESFLSSSGSFSARGGGHGHGYGDGDGGGKLVLNTWRRISLPLTRGFSITEFENYLDSPLPPQIVSKTCSQSQSSDRESKRETKLDSNIASDTDTDTELGNEGKKESKPPFSLPIYAQHAHSIISTLLSRYNPTHILIERQRFRSGGGSAVQEWSLRVGVFEGMVWAVLHTLRVQQLQERQQLSAGFGMGVGFYGGPRVFSIEPGRIGRYLISSGSSTTTTSFPDVSGDVDGTGTGKKRTTRSSREGKKLKIDLVGSWLENGLFEISADSDGVQPWVDEYLAKWKKEKKNKKDKKPAPNPKSKLKKISDLGTDNKGDVGARARVDIGKLDDLADCLIQGVTWLEWEGMKGRVGRDGVDAIRLDMS
ncbi:mitochondrial resolvase Ydc2 [Aspergillus cavernicola]|uniref:Mitochondrial resolvase Ydc2 n=1 Tax=Aspergillus cavernicola TaxID=176166 RepID=A0ABR4J2V9_9EURO